MIVAAQLSIKTPGELNQSGGAGGRGSRVACNFLEAIKPTLYNSLSNTWAISRVKWCFEPQLLRVERLKCEKLCKIMMSTRMD